MSSTSTNGSGTSPAGSAISPASTPSSRNASLKFCANQLQRTIVHSVPAAISSCSARCASGSPRPESSTSRFTPRAAASARERADGSGAPSTARSGK